MEGNWAYDILLIPRKVTKGIVSIEPGSGIRLESGTCNSLVFCARNKFLTLNAQEQMYLHTITEASDLMRGSDIPESKRRIQLPMEISCDLLFYGGNNRVILKGDESVSQEMR